MTSTNFCWSAIGPLLAAICLTIISDRVAAQTPSPDQYLVGDWNGDGKDDIAVRIGGLILMDVDADGRPDSEQQFGNGNSEDEYLVGDWANDGRDHIAVRRGNRILMSHDADGFHDREEVFGNGARESQYLVGDWNGNGRSDIAVRRRNLIVMDADGDGTADMEQTFGRRNDNSFLVGDWDGDQSSNVAVRRGNVVSMDYNFDKKADFEQTFGKGDAEDEYLVGDWDGDGRDNLAVRRGNEIHMDTDFDSEPDMVWTWLGKEQLIDVAEEVPPTADEPPPSPSVSVVQGTITITETPKANDPAVSPTECPDGQARTPQGTCEIVTIGQVVTGCPDGQVEAADGSCVAAAPVTPQVAPQPGLEGGQINIAPVPNSQPFVVGPNDPKPLASIVCTPAVGGEPRDNWMINMWPSPVTTNSKSLLVDAAVQMLNRRGIAVSDAELQRVAAGVKSDPVARYKFAPFMLGTFFDALVAENPTEEQAAYKAHFERYQGCQDYYRAVATLREWNLYQGTETIGSVPAYKPVLLSAVNFNHTPSVAGFIESDPLAYGPRGGEAVALLYSQMASKTGVLEAYPMNSALGSLNDDMTAVAVAAGVGSATAAPAVLVGGTAAYLAVATAKVATQIGVGVVPGVTTSALPANIAVSFANLAGPAIVAIAAAAILGSTIAEVAQKAALEEKLKNAASNPYFSVADLLNVPRGERETRRAALFTLMVKHLIANPVEAGVLSLELPEIPCLPDYGRATDGSCVLQVKFHSQAGLSLDKAQDISRQTGWRIATADEVQAAWEKLGFEAFAYGLLADGRFAVPVQSDMGGFSRGANIGAQGGNQGFFYVPRVEFSSWGGLSLKQAQDIAGNKGHRLATAAEVETAWAKQGLDVFSFGMIDDGRFAVPIQSDRDRFRRGANIGAQGGNQGFFFVRNAAQTPGDMYYRGQQTLECGPGTRMEDGLCYKPCDAGFGAVATRCYAACPAGFRDDGLYCAKPEPYTREGFPWQAGDPPLPNFSGPFGRCEAKYGAGACEEAIGIVYPKCREGFHAATVNICSPNCPSGMTDIGVSCQKDFYDRGVGQVPSVCPAGTEQIGALCYPLCRAGFRGQLDWCYKE